MNTLTSKLPKETQAVAHVADHVIGGTRQDFGRFGKIDFTKLTPRKATTLLKRKAPFLVAAPTGGTATPPAKSGK